MRWELAAFGRLAHARYGSQWHADTAVFVASKATSGFGCLKMETQRYMQERNTMEFVVSSRILSTRSGDGGDDDDDDDDDDGITREETNTRSCIWIITQAILCDLFGMLKWPFQRLSDLQLGDKKVAWNHLDVFIL